ncbi:helix-turn-helix domain-containing protein [Nonomuraea fuscirosea]
MSFTDSSSVCDRDCAARTVARTTKPFHKTEHIRGTCVFVPYARPMHSRSGEGTPPERIAAILSAFSPGDNLLGATQIARRTSLPRSTVHRLAADLVSCGLLERHGTGIRLGLRLFELGQRVPRRRLLRQAALPYMADLREATGQTVHLAVIEGSDVVYLEILEALDSPNLPSALGGRLPAAATGAGRRFSPSPRLTFSTRCWRRASHALPRAQ